VRRHEAGIDQAKMLRWWSKTAPSDAASDAPVVGARAAAAFASELAFDKVTRSFGATEVLRGVDLVVHPGEIVCLLGPSGSGKTTLLRIASGIERPTAGVVRVDGVAMAGPGVFVPPERRRVGLMFQDFALFPHLTVEDNVAFGLRKVPTEAGRRAARSLLARVGLSQHAQSRPHMLSGGEQQRVALARALLPRPAVMLMDEPFSGLDVQLRAEMQLETQRLLRETRSTGLIVTHSPDEALRLGDRIAVMHGGRLVQVGKAEDLYRFPADLFVARLFSDINEIPMTVTGGALRTPFGTFAAPDLDEGDAAVLCIRKRSVRVVRPAGSGEGVPGRVVGVRFMGDSVAMDLAVQGFEQPLTALTREERMQPKGSDIRVWIDAADVLVFRAG
jgi:iron(III) transport system ATP-binding protein